MISKERKNGRVYVKGKTLLAEQTNVEMDPNGQFINILVTDGNVVILGDIADKCQIETRQSGDITIKGDCNGKCNAHRGNITVDNNVFGECKALSGIIDIGNKLFGRAIGSTVKIHQDFQGTAIATVILFRDGILSTKGLQAMPVGLTTRRGSLEITRVDKTLWTAVHTETSTTYEVKLLPNNYQLQMSQMMEDRP